MPVPRSGVLWRRIFVLLLVATSASYIWYSRQEYPHGGSRWGLGYGIAGSLLILLLTYFGVRKRSYRSRFGTMEQWMQSHIYLGILAFVILLFHTGGRFNDAVAVATLLLVTIVVFSGIAGALLYVTIPRLLTEVESNLTVAELSEQLNQLTKQMARIATGHSAAFQRIYTELVRESMPGWLAGWRLLFSRMRRGPQGTMKDFGAMLSLVPTQEQTDLRQLLVVSRQRKELLLRLVYQQRYKNMLEAWLYLHVPFTLALILMAIVHVAGVFYYGRISW
jgi:hypothetical protein